MQVATLFGDNVAPFVSTSVTVNASSESVLPPMEGNDDKTMKYDNTENHMSPSTPLSSFLTAQTSNTSDVSSLVNLASSALAIEQHESQPIKDEADVDVGGENDEEAENHQQDDQQIVPTDENVSRNEETIPNESANTANMTDAHISSLDLREQHDDSQTKVMSSPSPMHLNQSPAHSPNQCQSQSESHTAAAEGQETNIESSSQATSLQFQERFLQHQQQQQHTPTAASAIDSCQIQQQNNEIPSVINPSSNIRETNGCATNNLSDMNDLEAENLVIHRNNHNSSLEGVKKPHDDINGVKRLLEEQSQSEEHFQRQQQQQQIAHEQHQLEYEQQIHQQVAEHISRRTEHSEKEETSKDDTQFHECHHNNLAAVTVDEHIQHQQQMSQQQQQNSNVDDYKLQHVPENLQMMNHLEQQHHQQQQHYQQEQQNMFEQQQQQLYLQHHQDQQQQHVAHQHHQHLQQQHHQQLQHHQQQQEHHHSELMAYLHHQEQQQQQQQQQHHHQQHHHHQQQQQQQHQQHQQALQQAHHVRTYQHYQQQQRMHQLTQLAQHAQPQSPHHQAKNTSMTCIDDLMIDDLQEDPNNRYKLLSPTVKHESQDDGYETSAGDVLTPNSHTSTRHSMTPQHQMQHSVNLVLPKCEDLSSTSASTSGGSGRHPDNGNGPYNFIEDVMSSPSSSNGCLSMVMRQQQNFESPTERRLLMEDNTHHNMPMNVVGNQQQQQIMDSRMQEDQTQAHTVIPSCSVSDNLPTPKKRGRKKKGSDEITVTSSVRTMVDGILKPILPKERKKHDRFNGMPEEEVSKRTLPDHLTDNLDIIIIGINPGLFAAYKGHHYAGPGNHFWKCLYLSGLTHEQMTAEEDYKLLKFGIGFTNMVERATKGSADLTRKEIKEGSRILLEKLKRFRPKIAVFNGKLIFEVFSGKKDFNFGRQQECVEGTDTYMWVMPSSSARCAQLPRAADKVPFYAALKKFRDYLNGLIPHIDDIECVFNDQKSKQCCEADSIGAVGAVNPTSSPFLSPDCLTNENQNIGFNNSNNSTPERNIIPDNVNLNKTNPGSMLEGSPIDSMLTNNNSDSSIGGCGMLTMSSNHLNNGNSIMQHMSCSGQQQQQPEKKKRGRPKKIKGIDGADGDGPAPPKVRNTNSIINNNNNVLNLTLMGGDGGEIPKKKRGRPKKIKSDVAAVNLNHGGTSMPTSNSNYQSNPHQNSIESAAHRDSPNNLVSHQFNSQFNSQQPMQQNQSLFNSPMHSPSNVSSYCPMSLNSPNTPPSGGSSQVYHHQQQQQQQQQQQLLNSQLMSHQNNHNLQQQQHVQQHQLHIPSLIYMHSPNHSLQQSQSQSKSPHYGSSQSDLSTEISAAISSDHLTAETQSTPASAASPAAAIAVDYDRPDSIPNEEHNSAHDLRFTSPNLDQTQMGRGPLTPQQAQHYHNIYQNNPSSNQSYLSSTNNVSNSPGGESSIGSGAHKNDEYIASSRKNTSNSNSTQQKNLQLSDVTSKSLSGLESLVDQIPTMAENDNSTIKSDSNEDFPSPSSGGGGGSGSRGGGSSNSSGGGLGCLYMPSYSSSSSSPSAVAIAAPPPVSPQHYPDPSFSAAANECHSSPNNSNDNGNGNNNLNNYNSITSNFSVSSLTSNNYPSNSYHSNLMASAAASSPHHITSTATGSPMYMDPHPHMAVSPLYHHPYAQHGYGPYTSVGPPPPPPPTLHMPSPNYPYAAYPNTSGYPNSQLPSHSSPAAAYLTSHPSMFDRIKPDIGYGGY